MKRNFFYGLIACLLAAPALADRGERSPDFDRVAERLGLDAAQAEQFSAAMLEQHERNKARIAPLREQMMQAREEIKRETTATASAILTPEQMEKFEQLQERRVQRRENRPGKKRERRRNGDQEEQL